MGPKKVVTGESQEPGLDITDVHMVWDGCPAIRDRLRSGKSFLDEKTGLACDNMTCALNSDVLNPILAGMGAHADRKLPSIGDLRNEMAICFRLNKRVGPEAQQVVASEAIHVRKMLSFVKAKVRREEVSVAHWQP